MLVLSKLLRITAWQIQYDMSKVKGIPYTVSTGVYRALPCGHKLVNEIFSLYMATTWQLPLPGYSAS